MPLGLPPIATNDARASSCLDPLHAITYPGHMPIPTMLSRGEVDYLYALAANLQRPIVRIYS